MLDFFKTYIKFSILLVIAIVVGFIVFMTKSDIPLERDEWMILVFVIIISFSVPVILILYLLRVYSGKSGKDKKLQKEVQVPEYYREIMHEKSPLLMAYLYHRRILKTDVMAHLNYLTRKKLISITDGKINILKTNSYKEDIYILNHLTSLESMNTLQELKKIMKEKAMEDGYLQKNTKKRIIALMIVLLIIWNMLGNLIFITLLPFAFFYMYLVLPFNLIKNKKDILYYTKQGYETLSKLQGLKNFLEDFGAMEHKTSDHLTLYEDYIVYGIILECSKSLMEDARKDFELIAKRN